MHNASLDQSCFPTTNRMMCELFSQFITSGRKEQKVTKTVIDWNNISDCLIPGGNCEYFASIFIPEQTLALMR